MTVLVTDLLRAPLLVQPTYHSTAWGGRRLAGWGKVGPDGADTPVGETHETGSEAVLHLPDIGALTLQQACERFGEQLLGARGMAVYERVGAFPLLVKFIDAAQRLSVQVHPDDATAPDGACGKTEAWVILETEPAAELIVGVRGAIDIAGIEAQLVRTEVTPGEVWFVPARTVHAIGAGVLLYEIQQPSHVTWRMYDWGRPREIHVEEALRVATPDQLATRLQPQHTSDGLELLVTCDFFTVHRLHVKMNAGQMLVPQPESVRVLSVIDGSITVDEVTLERGQSAVLPATMPAVAITGNGAALIASLPTAALDPRDCDEA